MKKIVFYFVALFILVANTNSQTITITPSIKYQTMAGWEAIEYTCQNDCSNFSVFQSDVLDSAIELGISRIRLELWTQSSCQTFDIADLDDKITKVINPLRAKMAAKGDTLWVNLCVVDAQGSCYGSGSVGGPMPLTHYASKLVEVYKHIQNTYGWIPDSWEIILEPNFVSKYWTPDDIGNATNLGYDSLVAAGFPPPYIIGPSAPGGGQAAIDFFDLIKASTPSAISKWKEFSYHRYAETDTYLAQIKSRAAANGLKAAMLEYGPGRYTDLHKDIKEADAVSWDRMGIAGYDDHTGYDGWGHFTVSSQTGTTFTLANDTKLIRQYYKCVHKGAVRIDATSTDNLFDPIAFKNRNGDHVVIVKSTGAGSFTIGGLPAGDYGIFYTLDVFGTATDYNTQLPDQTITTGQNISTGIPNVGVITIYQKNMTVGIKKRPEADHLILFPNPASDLIQVSTTNNDFISKAIMYDLQGKIVFTQKFNSAEKQIIDVTQLQNGVYHLQTLSNNKQYDTKIAILK